MGRRCKVCARDAGERQRMEELLSCGNSLSVVARAYGVTRSSLHRHWKNHVQRVGVLPSEPKGPVSYFALVEWQREQALRTAGARMDSDLASVTPQQGPKQSLLAEEP